MNQFNLHSYLQNCVCQKEIDLNIIFATNFYLINSTSYCAHIANSMDSFESCMTHQHHLEFQCNQMRKQRVNESFIKHES